MTEGNSGAGAPSRFRPSSIRIRLVASFVVFLTMATAATVFVVRVLEIRRLDERLDRELVQESRELRALAAGNDPDTGEPFGGDVREIFRTYLQRNIPSRNETVVTFVNGDPFLRGRREVPYRLDTDAQLATRWAALTEPERGRADTPAGEIQYLAVPLNADGATRGVFVAAFFRDLELRESDSALAGTVATGAIIALIGSILAWRIADRILTPVEQVRRTAHSISDTDLNRRIEVKGNDEISELARTFNDMLDRLEESFDTQKQFIDDASHELRTPITIVRGHLETIDAVPEDRDRTMALVLDELDRMARLVDDLLLLVRSERPDFLDLSVVDVATLTDEVKTKAEAIAPRAWKSDATGIGRIVADRQRLTQALIQLAQNASQYTADGAEIGIGSSVGNGAATFWVRDTGPGVGTADRSRIFERFSRGRGGKRSEGSGLGLAIVRAIATAHHGRLELESDPGRGATFRVVVPIDPPEGGRGG